MEEAETGGDAVAVCSVKVDQQTDLACLSVMVQVLIRMEKVQEAVTWGQERIALVNS